MTVVAVTGASGFVGSALCHELRRRHLPTIPLLRAPHPLLPEARVVGDIGPDTRWAGQLTGVDVVIHCAARAHVPLQSDGQDLEVCRRINVEGTRQLAQAAAAAGVRRLVYVSSVKALGERSLPGAPLQHDSAPHPEDAYGISKHEAEQALASVASSTGLQAVIVRPPLVYGRGVKANFLKLLQAVARGLPLPLGSVDNRRSLVALDNLTDLLVSCVDHPDAAGQSFLVSDGEDLSTPALIRQMAQALHRPAHLLPCPPSLLALAGRLTGREATVERLIGHLQVDIGHTTKVLGWTPKVSVQQGLQSAVQDLPR
ncbi:NAD-dependent epimerase/dehydratase family protein [Hydrogenophaga sp.]|uniref:NAD-dependent epimerase/dehydratase family protein n=1 Tax=Hydrogenophaga sp. TaxID=1904254 RepID=UPI0035B3DDE2